MICPYCGDKEERNNFVIDTRWSYDKGAQRRRYECRICKLRFTTYETYDTRTERLAKQLRALKT